MINAEIVSAKLIEVKAIRIPPAHPSRTILLARLDDGHEQSGRFGRFRLTESGKPWVLSVAAVFDHSPGDGRGRHSIAV